MEMELVKAIIERLKQEKELYYQNRQFIKVATMAKVLSILHQMAGLPESDSPKREEQPRKRHSLKFAKKCKAMKRVFLRQARLNGVPPKEWDVWAKTKYEQWKAEQER